MTKSSGVRKSQMHNKIENSWKRAKRTAMDKNIKMERNCCRHISNMRRVGISQSK